MNKRICIMCKREFNFWHSRAKTCGKECSKNYGKLLKKLYKINNPEKVKKQRKKYYNKCNKKTIPKIKECKICNKKYISNRGNSKTCSNKCSKKNTMNNIIRNGKIYLKRYPDRRKATSHRYSINNREKLKENSRIWRKNNPDKVNIQVNKWRRNNKKKRNAQANAQRNIIIPKDKKCEICKEKKAIQRHHEDYDKPLNVMLLCSMCHSNIHRKKICVEVWNE